MTAEEKLSEFQGSPMTIRTLFGAVADIIRSANAACVGDVAMGTETLAVEAAKLDNRRQEALRELVGLLEDVLRAVGQTVRTNPETAERLLREPQEPTGYEPLAETLENLCESVDIFLDEARGARLHDSVVVLRGALRSETEGDALKAAADDGLTPAALGLAYGSRPQDGFKGEDRVDTSNAPFVPFGAGREEDAVRERLLRLREAFEKRVREESVAGGEDHSSRELLGVTRAWKAYDEAVGRRGQFAPGAHPLGALLDEMDPAPPYLLSGCEVEGALRPLPPPSDVLRQKAVTMVRTEEELAGMLAHLKGEEEGGVKAGEIAFDVEAHSRHSFAGLSCLLQIATRRRTFVVDTLELRASKLSGLAEVFADPSVVKVAHGADSDVVWLQRCLGVYVARLFDTGQAARELGLPSAGLAYLLRTYAGVEADKSLQLADWRTRRQGRSGGWLPNNLLHYAAEDVHLLLGIYDRLRNELLRSASEGARTEPLARVWRRSHELCRYVYERPRLTLHTAKLLARKMRAEAELNSEERCRAFAALVHWRDHCARETDEALETVLPRKALLRIAKLLPDSMSRLLSACQPLPPAVRAQSDKVLELIAKARNKCVGGEYFVGEDADEDADADADDGRLQEAKEGEEDLEDLKSSTPSPTTGEDAAQRLVSWLEQDKGRSASGETETHAARPFDLCSGSVGPGGSGYADGVPRPARILRAPDANSTSASLSAAAAAAAAEGEDVEKESEFEATVRKTRSLLDEMELDPGRSDADAEATALRIQQQLHNQPLWTFLELLPGAESFPPQYDASNDEPKPVAPPRLPSSVAEAHRLAARARKLRVEQAPGTDRDPRGGTGMDDATADMLAERWQGPLGEGHLAAVVGETDGADLSQPKPPSRPSRSATKAAEKAEEEGHRALERAAQALFPHTLDASGMEQTLAASSKDTGAKPAKAPPKKRGKKKRK